MEKKFFVKVHRSYRAVVAICDAELIGKKFEEGKRQLDVRDNFYRGEEMNLEKTIDVINVQRREDATFNIVGKDSVNAAIEVDLIDKNSVGKVDGVPFALILF